MTSPWIEVQSKRTGANVADAVGALANPDGGLVLAGVLDDKDAEPGAGAAGRPVGVLRREYDAITDSLRYSVADATPEIPAIAVPGSAYRLVLVLRGTPTRWRTRSSSVAASW